MGWFDDLLSPFDRMRVAISDALFGSASVGEPTTEARQAAQNEAPVIWLVGKTGSGKSAIVAALTGNEDARIGEGYEPCTRTSRLFDFPAEAPLVRFLDTRGLEEPGYDPKEDLAWCESQAHVLLAVMRVDDPTQVSVLDVLRAARRRHPEWPVVVVQTTLHALYGARREHPRTYPFVGGIPQGDVSFDLGAALSHQRSLFAGFPGQVPCFVPIDFTRYGDGFDPIDFGEDALLAALTDAGLQAVAIAFDEARQEAADQLRQSCRPLILACAVVAAGGAAIPVPFVDFVSLTTTIGFLLRALADRYNTEWSPGTFAQFFSAIGGGTLAWWCLRFGAQELLKIIPVIGTAGGAALNATAAFSLTFGIGEAACVWLAYQAEGRTAPDAAIVDAFKTGMRRKRPAVRAGS